MPTITYNKVSYLLPENLSVLEGLEQHGVTINSSCRSGTCQTCKKKVIKGSVPSAAQVGLKPTEQIQGYFLPCICFPSEDITITEADYSEVFISEVVSVQALNEDVAEVKIKCPSNFNYFAGQYIQLFKDNTIYRNYSLASLPKLDEPLTLHVKKIHSGQVSPWVHQLVPGERLKLAGPLGNCFYQDKYQQQPLLLIGTGSGLSPLYGILRDALLKGHQEDIWIFHGVNEHQQLYHQRLLNEIASKHPQVHYFPCVSNEEIDDCEHGMVTDIAFKKLPSLKNFAVYLSGSPAMVKQASMKAFLSGASMADIYKDPFS